uniref:Uncharacterized protein n=1 Tax=Arion vulgaris TaxID=1028688 RepID=A0A0B6ZIT8_9EUPU
MSVKRYIDQICWCQEKMFIWSENNTHFCYVGDRDTVVTGSVCLDESYMARPTEW